MIRLYYLLSIEYGAYYDEAGILIANDFDELILWFKSQDFIIDVVELIPPTGGSPAIADFGLSCNVYKIFYVTAQSNIPIYFNADGVGINNRIFGKRLSFFTPDLSLLCNSVAINDMCATPQTATILVETSVCDTPTTDTILVEQVNGIFPVTTANSWLVDAQITSASKIGNIVNLCYKATKAAQSGPLSNDLIGTIDPDITPNYEATISHTDQANIPASCFLTINTIGEVRWTGNANADAGTTIEFSNIIYNLTNA